MASDPRYQVGQKSFRYHELFNPTLKALHKLGGSGTIQEIHDEVVSILGLSEEQVALQSPGKGNQTALYHSLALARTWLKKYGLVNNSQWGVWALTPEGQRTEDVDTQKVRDKVASLRGDKNQVKSNDDLRETNDADLDYSQLEDEVASASEEWREVLSRSLQEMNPTAFERLCQRVLRESGFTKVEVTKPSHDGGIDGKGVLQVNDFLSFRVVFQCKRYTGTVGPDVVQRLRGVMPPSADRGLIVTTGNFTTGAVREAAREDLKPIELVDGTRLMDKLKELRLGVTTELVEKVTVDGGFFQAI